MFPKFCFHIADNYTWLSIENRELQVCDINKISMGLSNKDFICVVVPCTPNKSVPRPIQSMYSVTVVISEEMKHDLRSP